MIRYCFFISLFLLIPALHAQVTKDPYGAIVRSDSTQKVIYLCFTGHDHFEGFDFVLEVLKENNIQGSFFLTGDFVRNHPELVRDMRDAGHFVGAHSDRHLLYCDWDKRDSLLIPPDEIRRDILANVEALEEFGVFPRLFMPPYEWYNAEVVEIARQLGQTTVNFSPGTRSNADYTTPEMENYISSHDILRSIYQYESSYGMNGFHLLIHPGTEPERTDKLYTRLPDLVKELKQRGYGFGRFE